MKKWLLLIAVVIIAVTTMSFTGSLKKLWAQYDASEKNGLPKTSIEILTEIQKKAKSKKDIGHYFKATFLKSQKNLDLGYSNSKNEIKELESWLQSADSPSDKAILSTLLFSNYINYYSSKSYRYAQRTNLSDEDSISDDIDLWTTNQFSAKITSLYNGIWADRKALLAKSAKDYIPFVEINDFGKYFNHDLYHVLYWFTLGEFSKYPVGPDWDRTIITNLRAQVLEDYSSNPEAIFLLQLNELVSLTGAEHWMNILNTPIEERLEKVNKLIEANKDSELVVEAVLAKMDMLLPGDDDTTDYLALIDEMNVYINKYPKYSQTPALKQIIEQIQAPYALMEAKRYVHTDECILKRFTYKNIDKAIVKLYRWTNKEDIQSVLKNTSITDEVFRKMVIDKNTELVDQLSLEGIYTTDHKSVINDKLNLSSKTEGTYILSVESEKSKHPVYNLIYVHNTAFINISEGNKTYDFITVDALSGYPVSGVQINLTSKPDNKTKPIEVLGSLTTDESGRVSWTIPEKGYSGEYLSVDVVANGQHINDQRDNIYVGSLTESIYNDAITTHLITDRKLYRPGQTIYVKGYLYQQDTATGLYKVLPNHKGELIASDNSSFEIAKNTIQTNEYGSFTAEVVLPNSILNGHVQLQFSGEDYVGYQTVLVEEYKRPTFKMSLLPVEGLYTIGSKVVVKGKVESFSQSLLANARLEAEVSYYDSSKEASILVPCRFIKPILKASSVSVNDSLMFDKEGKFSLEVDMPKHDRFYKIKVKLVAADGEVEIAEKSLRVGEGSYNTRSTMPYILNLDETLEVGFTAFNFDGSAVDAKGRYEIFVKGEAYTRGKKALISGKFDTKEKLRLDLKGLPVGEYTMVYIGELEKSDNSINFQVFSKKKTDVPVTEGDWAFLEKAVFSKDSPAVIYFGTGDKDVYAFVDIYSTQGKVSTENIVLNSSYTKIEVPYKEEYKNGVTVIFSYYKDHKLFIRKATLRLDAKSENLSLKWLTFRDHISAGAKENWTLQVLDEAGKVKSDVELLALMYDASLDQLMPGSFDIQSEDRFQFNSVRLPQVYIQSPYRTINERTNLVFNQDSETTEPKPFSFDKFFFNYRNEGAPRVQTRLGVTHYIRGGEVESLSVEDVSYTANPAPPTLKQKNQMDAKGGAIAPQIRSNFNETAFFIPALYANKQGKVSIDFTSPEQMTKWNVRVFAHTKDMVVGYSDKIAYTERKFAITMNNPRFIRQGDKVLLSAILKNDLPTAVKSSIDLVLFDPQTDKQIAKFKQHVSVGSHSEATVVFELPKLEGRDKVGVRMIADAGKLSDGEQYIIPVLSNIEPFITGKSIVAIDPGKTTVQLPVQNKLAKDNKTEVLVEFTSNPLWFTITPILRTWTNESNSAAALSSKLAVGSVAYNLWKSNPEFIQSFTKENAYKSFDSNAEFRIIQNQETPWLFMPKNQASTLSQFNDEVVKNTSQIQISTYLNRLKALQTSEGGFSWYEGMEANTYITLSVLQNLSIFTQDKNAGELNLEVAGNMMESALNFLFDKMFTKDVLNKLEKPSAEQLELAVIAMAHGNPTDKAKVAIKKIEEKLPVLLKDGSLLDRSLALHFALLKGDKSIANKFAESLEEHLIEGKEDGVHFAGREFDSLSLNSQMRVHTLAMQALYSWKKDQNRLNSMKFWLATVISNERVYNEFEASKAISAIGLDANSSKTVESSLVVELGKEKLTLNDKSPYVKQTITIDGAMPELVLTKTGNQVVWGRAITKYYAKITDVKSTKSDIDVETKYYIERVVNNKKELKEINESTPLKQGDMVVSRVVFKLASNIDFVQITDSRAGNLEPLVTNSGYRWNALFRGLIGLPSYVSVRDASTQYFFYFLEKGTYVLENRSYVVRDGTYQTGSVTIQSAYSPELSGYSGSSVIKSGK